MRFIHMPLSLIKDNLIQYVCKYSVSYKYLYHKHSIVSSKVDISQAICLIIGLSLS